MKSWRESASLIIAAKNALKNTPLVYEYNLLFLKRQQNATFAGTYVFPGGLIESADADLKWEKLYKDHGFNPTSFKSLFPNSTHRPELFRKVPNQISREISLRISAIRETFEECGILLCEKSGTNKEFKTASHLSIPKEELQAWQHKVHKNADEFYNMCDKYECYPNVWALHEWANWLTPTFFPPKVRFNAAFFLTGLPHVPESIIESGEVEELVWTHPDRMIESYIKHLMIPQLYEITRVAHHKKLDDLIEYAVNKSKEGVDTVFPVTARLADGIALVLPGDSMYPEVVEYHKKQFIDRSAMTIEEFRNISPKRLRVERFDNPEMNITISRTS